MAAGRQGGVGCGRPLIGVGSWLEHVRWQGFKDRVAFAELGCLEKLEAAGACTVIVPPQGLDCPQLFDLLDGVLLAGGPDLFSQENELRPKRDAAELDLARRALGSGVPVLGLCRGCQVLNVAGGGTLVPEVEDRFTGVEHRAHKPKEERPFKFAHHEVKAVPGGRLAQIMPLRFDVLSSHHQAVDEPAPGFTVAGHSPDGLIEAISVDSHPFALGVQWHPESGIDDSLFRALVDAARSHLELRPG